MRILKITRDSTIFSKKLNKVLIVVENDEDSREPTSEFYTKNGGKTWYMKHSLRDMLTGGYLSGRFNRIIEELDKC